ALGNLVVRIAQFGAGCLAEGVQRRVGGRPAEAVGGSDCRCTVGVVAAEAEGVQRSVGRVAGCSLRGQVGEGEAVDGRTGVGVVEVNHSLGAGVVAVFVGDDADHA